MSTPYYKSFPSLAFSVILTWMSLGLLPAMSLCDRTVEYAEYQIEKIDTLPKVFMIGQNESDYELLVTKCNNPLLTVCDESMDLAYRRWILMLNEMEIYAEKSDFDIKGIKMWLNVFWNPDGTIQHLVYFPKPNSRNMDFDLLTLFMDKFVAQYQMEENDKSCFSHYGSAAFPTFADYYLQEK